MYRSDDEGKTFTGGTDWAVKYGSCFVQSMCSINGILYATAGGCIGPIYQSADNGKTWLALDRGAQKTSVSKDDL